MQKSAVVVETIAQSWVPPTAANLHLHRLLEILPATTERMVVARLGDIERSPHAGLMVHGGRVSCECVLALVAATEKSKGDKFGSGFMVLTKNVQGLRPVGHSEFSDRRLPGAARFHFQCGEPHWLYIDAAAPG